MIAAWRIARRELRGGLSGFRIFLLCLSLGVGAIAAVGSVRAALETGLSRQGAVLLGGDAELRLTYRFAEPAERAWMASRAGRLSEVVDFRSMAVAGGDADAERALTQVKGVDGNWPLQGQAQFDPPLPVAQVLAGRDGLPGAAMEPLLIDRLGLAVGDRFRLGVQDFVLTAALLREPDAAGSGFGLGPRTLVATEALGQSGLLAPGTLYETSYRLTLPAGGTLDGLRAAAMAEFDGAGMRWRDSRRGAPGVERFVDRLGSFLVLVGLAGLAVGGVGVSSAVRSYLDGKTAVIATLKTLGAEGRTIFAVYFMQIGALTLLGVGAGVFLGGLAPLAVAPLLESRLPIPAEFALYPAPLAESALYGTLTALIFTLLPLARVEGVRAAALFRGIGADAAARPRGPYLAGLVLAAAALIGAATALASVPRLALGLSAGVAAALGALWLAARGLRALARRLARHPALRGRTALRLAMGAVGNPQEGAVAVVLSLGLGLTVLATVGQIDANLRRAIAAELPERAPSFFFIDIQPDQLAGFQDRLAADPGVDAVETAPSLRGIITAINGIPAREWGDHWVLRGDRGVSHAAAPPEGTVLTEGDWWPADYAGPPLLSFGAEEAGELGLAVGDRVTVNILGRDITATVANLRQVDFRSGGIGFVMILDAAALKGAPQTHIATVQADAGAEGRILRDISNAYPNITAVRVREVAQRVGEAMAALASATSLAAMATLATGFVVLIGAAAAGERARVFEAAVLKTLGATRRQVLASFALRSALMGAAAGLVAAGVAALAAWTILTQVMEMDYRFVPGSALGIVAGGVLATLAAGLVFALRPLSARPARVLRAKE
ncbi:FtsX-like permease family protein [Paracoccus sediminis]|uniref:FtsX-like permease family protein n=1 Tax=Paracoccus sediminis TaxID=1214787 RepID=A0A238VHF6_9RHOB|nr:FtsX-like permease family protein [Paracoccus sediminis]TBN52085.1 FtsX-like permease family protein [Paracoccus sediminis]SNR33527.1 putative ABC transport system permease protein [Paracoccus sediminis]